MGDFTRIQAALVVASARQLLEKEPPLPPDDASSEDYERHRSEVERFVWEWRGAAKYVLGELADLVEQVADPHGAREHVEGLRQQLADEVDDEHLQAGVTVGSEWAYELVEAVCGAVGALVDEGLERLADVDDPRIDRSDPVQAAAEDRYELVPTDATRAWRARYGWSGPGTRPGDEAFVSESAAIQTWIDGGTVLCAHDGQRIIRGGGDGRWHHWPPTGEGLCADPEPKIIEDPDNEGDGA